MFDWREMVEVYIQQNTKSLIEPERDFFYLIIPKKDHCIIDTRIKRPRYKENVKAPKTTLIP
jgi:hypothetical protein